jgi:pimeloyl-ACP methyl ester carboxylesterase
MATTATTTETHPTSDLAVEVWGEGTPVVLVHGSLATGAEEWEAQRPLADEGFRLLVPDRRGYGRSRRPRARTSCGTRRTSPS